MNFVQIVVDRPILIRKPLEEERAMPESLRERGFTYSIPEYLTGKVGLGQLVWVPFGSRRIQGIVVAFTDTSPVELPKDIEEIIDPRPVVSETQLDLARWIARTYLCSLYAAISLMLPPGIEQPTAIFLTLAEAAPALIQHSGERVTPKQAQLLELVTREKRVNLNKIPRDLRSAVDALVKRSLIIKETHAAPRRAKPKRVKSVRLISDEIPAALEPRNPQADALEYLARAENALRAPTVKEVCAAGPCNKNTLATLVRKEWIEISEAREIVALTPKYFSDLPALPEAQARILVRLRDQNAPLPRKELRARPNILRVLEAKGYVERLRSEATVVTQLTPQELSQHASELRSENPKGTFRRYATIVSFLKKESGSVWISAVYAATNSTLQDLKKLEAVGLIALEAEEVTRDSLAGRTFDGVEPPKLTPEQEAAWEEIAASAKREAKSEKPECFLLHGVTGSGKTEIYLRTLAEVVAQGKQGIALVPEISLTPQTIRRFGARFKRIAVFHSKLSVGERYDTWRRCRDGLVDVVIGSRSALFTPLPRLGLIAIDEEHEPAYKQENAPHYHARAVALELAQRVGATVILGSATPDVETYHRATRGEFKLLALPKRVMGHTKTITRYQSPPLSFGDASQLPMTKSARAVRELGADFPDARYMELPPVEIVDLRAELKAGNRSMFSRALQREMARVLAANEQVILFLNRRGSATFILCRDCGHVFKCKRCDNPLTYHGYGNELQCHHCGRRDRVPTKCPNCKSARIRFFGIGTEKVEEEIQRAFPKARTLRWDLDATRGKDSHEAILERFSSHQADVMIGTQMIAKGLDLPLVTLVGIISADTSLNLPDFRAGERTFQLLTQVAGRAGRSILGGKVILQTYNPDHYAITAASQHDYHAFYAREISFRRESGYPPFNRLIRLLYANASEPHARAETERMHRALTERLAQKGLPAIDLIGPAPAYFHRIRGEYRFQILVRGDAEHPHALLETLALPLGWRVDVDPVSLL